MTRFAEYSSAPRELPRLGDDDGLVVRPTTVADLPAVARIVAEREESDPEVVLERLTRELTAQLDAPEPRRILWVAALPGRVIGHARASWFSPPPGAPANTAPEGWYLGGVIVEPAFRRRGVGEALTRARLLWIGRRSRRAHYFANARNRVTIDLHAKLGFVELTRDFWFPDTAFTGGVGVLFACDLPLPSAVPAA